jgi:carbon-monoxide dehydrogenase small subunit
MTEKLMVRLNGVDRTEPIDGRMMLVEALRERFGATGPKVGCLNGDCGSCTVRLNGAIVKSCLIPAVAADGAEVRTIEGLAAEDGALSPVQRAFWDHFGFQCGFCLSGMLFVAEELAAREDPPDEEEIRVALRGNLCRCTGYDTIVDACMAVCGSDR